MAHKAVSGSRRKKNNVDSSAVSGEHTDSGPLSERWQRGERELHKGKTVITRVLDDNLHENSV